MKPNIEPIRKVRRQVYELTLHDLDTYPVWEFGLDQEGEEGRDESTVRPYTVSGPLDPTDRMFVVRAVFTLADGSRMRGYFTPPGRGDASLGTLQPIIVTDRGEKVASLQPHTPNSRPRPVFALKNRGSRPKFPVDSTVFISEDRDGR